MRSENDYLQKDTRAHIRVIQILDLSVTARAPTAAAAAINAFKNNTEIMCIRERRDNSIEQVSQDYIVPTIC